MLHHMIINWHQNKPWIYPIWLDDYIDVNDAVPLLIGKLPVKPSNQIFFVKQWMENNISNKANLSNPFLAEHDMLRLS